MIAIIHQIRNKARSVRVWMVLTLLFAAAIPVSNYLTLQSAMQRLRFVAMDSRGTFYLTSAGGFETAQHIHADMARLAVETLYNRNPEGFDNKDRLERLFSPEM